MSPVPTLRRHAALGGAIVLVAQLRLILDTTIVNVSLPRFSAVGIGGGALGSPPGVGRYWSTYRWGSRFGLAFPAW